MKAQPNLVPNWSFEDTISCYPSMIDLSKYIKNWFSGSQGSPDYFRANSNSLNVPNNVTGFQYPRTGSAYVGGFFFDSPTDPFTGREYVSVKLKDSLNVGKRYCISFYVSLADLQSATAIDSIGAYISHDSVYTTGISSWLNVNESIASSDNIYYTDTMNWKRVEGIHATVNNEKYITIGNFNDNAHTDYFQIVPPNYTSYYYIDDVSVVEINSANAGKDTVICTNQVHLTLGSSPTWDASYNWYALNGSGTASIDSVNIAQPHVQPTQTTTYVLQKTQCSSITYDTITVYMTMPALPANAGIDYTICKGDTVVLGTPQNGNGCSYGWNPATGLNSSTIAMPAVFSNNLQISSYIYILSKTDSCRITQDTVQIIVNDCTPLVPLDIQVPNVFTPNYDGLNDVFKITYSGVTEVQLNIYDRWGLQLFETTLINQSWDGRTESGEPCSEGTYYYVLKAKGEKESKEIRGFIELNR